jgi:hypothetical protein
MVALLFWPQEKRQHLFPSPAKGNSERFLQNPPQIWADFVFAGKCPLESIKDIALFMSFKVAAKGGPWLWKTRP